MDPITAAIIAGLLTGVATGATQAVAEKIGGGAYNNLKQLIRNKFGTESDLADAVGKLEKDPNSKSRQGLVEEEVEKSGAYQDAELVNAAKTLLHALQNTPEGEQVVGKFNLTLENSQVGVIGDNTTVKGGIHFGPGKKETRIIHHVGRDYYERIEGDVSTGTVIHGGRAQHRQTGIDALKSKEELQKRYSLLSERLSKLHKACIIENDTAAKFKLEKQIEENEADLKKIEERLEARGK